MNRCTSGLRSLIDAWLYESMMAWAIVLSLTMRRLMNRFCGPRAPPLPPRRAPPPAVDPDFRAALLAARPRPQHEMRDRRDRRQRLAAETEREDRRQVVGAFDLAGGMALDREAGIVRLHPLAVVLDPHLFLASKLHVDPHAARAGVDGVLDELFDDGGWTLDHFARGDLVGEVGGEAVDSTHGSDPAAAAETGEHQRGHRQRNADHPPELRVFTARKVRQQCVHGLQTRQQ